MSRMFFDILEVNIAISVILLVLCFGAEKLRKRYGASWMKLVWLLLAIRLIVPYNFSLPFAEIKFFCTPDFEQEESVFHSMPEVQEGIVIEDNRENYDMTESLQAAEEVNIPVEYNNLDTVPSNNTVIILGKEDVEEKNSQTVGVSEEAVVERESISYADIMTGIWILGIIITSLYNVFCYLCFSLEIKKGLKELTDEELKWKILEMQKLFVGEPLPIYQSRRIFSPMLIGIIKPRLVVPSCMTQWNDDELEMIVAHELCHYKKKDVLLKLFMVVTCCLNWFNPLMYWMKKQFFYDVELSCDGTVLMERSEEERENYARIMLAFAGKPKQLSAFSTGFSESKKSMRKRIDYMLDTGRRKNGILSISLACVVIMTITAFVSCGYTSMEIEEGSNHGQEGIVTGQSNEHGTQEELKADSASQDMPLSFDYNHEYNEMLRSYEDSVYLGGSDGIYCIKAGGVKELIYENAYHSLRGMEIYQDVLYFCGSASDGERTAATIYRMDLETGEVVDALASFSNVYGGLTNISIYDGKLYALADDGKRIGFELDSDGQIIKLLNETKADFLFKEYNAYIDLKMEIWNTAFGSEKHKDLVRELNEKYCPVMDVAACKKLLQGRQVVSKYKDEMYRSIYLEKEDGTYEFLCDTVHSLSPLVTETGVYYVTSGRGEIGYVDYVTKIPQQIYTIDGTEEVSLVNYDAEYVYLVKKSDLDWEADENSAKEVSLLRIPRAGGPVETIYQLEGDLEEYGWLVQCAVYENHIYFPNQNTIYLETKTDISSVIDLQSLGQDDVNTEVQFLYSSCELSGRNINIYRNNDNELVIATSTNSEEDIIAVYPQWQSNDFTSIESRIKKGTAPDVTTNYSDLFAQEAVMIELPMGANTNIYFILVSNGDNMELIFHTIGRGLEVGNIDGDKENELISVLEGYFYDWQDNQLHIVEATSSANIDQLVREGDEAQCLAFGKVLWDIYQKGTLPDGRALDYSSMKAAESNSYSLTDIDFDGKEELLLRWTQASMAGTVEYIFGYDNEAIYVELAEFPRLMFYDNGIVEGSWSHNQGLAGDFWPYNVYCYDGMADTYQLIGRVDAWDKKVREKNYEDAPFPTSIDVDGDGVVYYLLPANWDGMYDEIHLVDGADYLKWKESYLDGAKEISISYQKLTEENIAELGYPKPDIQVLEPKG